MGLIPRTMFLGLHGWTGLMGVGNIRTFASFVKGSVIHQLFLQIKLCVPNSSMLIGQFRYTTGRRSCHFLQLLPYLERCI